LHCLECYTCHWKRTSGWVGKASKSASAPLRVHVCTSSLRRLQRVRSCRSRLDRRTPSGCTSVPCALPILYALRTKSSTKTFLAAFFSASSLPQGSSRGPIQVRARFSPGLPCRKRLKPSPLASLLISVGRPAGTLAKLRTTVETASAPRWTGVWLSDALGPGRLAARSEMLEQVQHGEPALSSSCSYISQTHFPLSLFRCASSATLISSVRHQ
jgi:hypothetical protein